MSRPIDDGATSDGATSDGATSGTTSGTSGGRGALIGIAWAWVTIPFLYGVVTLAARVPALF